MFSYGFYNLSYTRGCTIHQRCSYRSTSCDIIRSDNGTKDIHKSVLHM
nr:MAG TPA: Rapid ALkalinization Factor (RALF) [Crassvirales sp.]